MNKEGSTVLCYSGIYSSSSCSPFLSFSWPASCLSAGWSCGRRGCRWWLCCCGWWFIRSGWVCPGGCPCWNLCLTVIFRPGIVGAESSWSIWRWSRWCLPPLSSPAPQGSERKEGSSKKSQRPEGAFLPAFAVCVVQITIRYRKRLLLKIKNIRVQNELGWRWWTIQDLNLWPPARQADALPAELIVQTA